MRKLSVLFFLFIVVSCSLKPARDPINTAEKISAEQISLGGVIAEMMQSMPEVDFGIFDTALFGKQINQLGNELEQLKVAREELKGTALSDQWEELNQNVLLRFEDLSRADLQAWVNLNDSLLKYTEEVRFADALERVVYNSAGENSLSEKQIKSFFYTQLYDRVFFNVYGSSSLQYEHTTGGVVRLVQATDYPYDGKIRLKIELQDTRFLNFYFRIPEWADRASVVCKGVKYKAVPGEFTEIAKKWKNGDEVEILIGMRPSIVERKQNDPAFSLTYGSLFLSYPQMGSEALVYQNGDPIQYLNFVSSAGKMPTFIFSGLKDTTLVLQPLLAQQRDSVERTAWIQKN
ncbi:hypothetical protein [Sunxiuqinia sp. sy24]|uniref:hypothetical protein n=1 Tax=Sunxiuqinia sp. sy24 TaxID=3461495 RepID=UPI0040463111